MDRQTRARVRFILLTIVAVIKTLISLISASLLGKVLIPYAAQERGYGGAYGSEWILIIGSFCITYWLLTIGFEMWVQTPTKRGVKNGKVQTMPPSVKNSRMRRSRIWKSLLQKGLWKAFSIKRKKVPYKHSKPKRAGVSSTGNPTVICGYLFSMM